MPYTFCNSVTLTLSSINLEIVANVGLLISVFEEYLVQFSNGSVVVTFKSASLVIWIPLQQTQDIVCRWQISYNNVNANCIFWRLLSSSWKTRWHQLYFKLAPYKRIFHIQKRTHIVHRAGMKKKEEELGNGQWQTQEKESIQTVFGNNPTEFVLWLRSSFCLQHTEHCWRYICCNQGNRIAIASAATAAERTATQLL